MHTHRPSPQRTGASSHMPSRWHSDWRQPSVVLLILPIKGNGPQLLCHTLVGPLELWAPSRWKWFYEGSQNRPSCCSPISICPTISSWGPSSLWWTYAHPAVERTCAHRTDSRSWRSTWKASTGGARPKLDWRSQNQLSCWKHYELHRQQRCHIGIWSHQKIRSMAAGDPLRRLGLGLWASFLEAEKYAPPFRDIAPRAKEERQIGPTGTQTHLA